MDVKLVDHISYDFITKFTFLTEEPRLQYPFFYRPLYPILEDGWTAFRPETEFSPLISSQSEEWRISYVNKDFTVCI